MQRNPCAFPPTNTLTLLVIHLWEFLFSLGNNNIDLLYSELNVFSGADSKGGIKEAAILVRFDKKYEVGI